MSDLNLEGLTDAQLRLYAVCCVRRVQRLMTDPRSVAVLDVAERHAKGEATDKELSTAMAAAADAALAAAWAAEAAATAAEAAAAAAAWDAERAEQQKILDEIREVRPCEQPVPTVKDSLTVRSRKRTRKKRLQDDGWKKTREICS